MPQSQVVAQLMGHHLRSNLPTIGKAGECVSDVRCNAVASDEGKPIGRVDGKLRKACCDLDEARHRSTLLCRDSYYNLQDPDRELHHRRNPPPTITATGQNFQC